MSDYNKTLQQIMAEYMDTIAAQQAEIALLEAWIDEAVEYVGSPTWSPSLQAEGRALLKALEGGE